MLELVSGCSIPKPELLFEQYEVDGNYITANVNASKISDIVRHFITMQRVPLFFILELPTNANVEAELRKSDQAPMHTDVYYIDLLSAEQSLSLLEQYGELLIQDGLVQFGFGLCCDVSSEIMVRSYNVVSIYSEDLSQYLNFFDFHHIPQAEHCLTAWETFTPDAPGRCSTIQTDGVSIYDLPEKLKDRGIYFAERREQ